MIDLTPVDVRKKKGDFRRTMRGYDPEMVDDFLDLVADRLDQLVRESIALNERAVRQDREVADYRDRERALTEALVTAQEMREEIRKQTSREADVIRQEAEQLRSATQQELAELRASVEQEIARMRAAAEEEASQLRSVAERDTVELRTTVREERERGEEAVRELRQRQQDLLEGYRSLLERELANLGVLAGKLGLPATAAAAAALAVESGEPEPEPEPEPGATSGRRIGRLGPGRRQGRRSRHRGGRRPPRDRDHPGSIRRGPALRRYLRHEPARRRAVGGDGRRA
jgi:cell division initiation protein